MIAPHQLLLEDTRSRRRIAYHEAGHAVAARALGRKVAGIEWTLGENPFTEVERKEYRFGGIRPFGERAIFLFAGYIATQCAFPGERGINRCAAGSDFDELQRWRPSLRPSSPTTPDPAWFGGSDALWRAFLRLSFTRCHVIVSGEWLALSALASTIEEQIGPAGIFLIGPDLDELLDPVTPRPWVDPPWLHIGAHPSSDSARPSSQSLPSRGA